MKNFFAVSSLLFSYWLSESMRLLKFLVKIANEARLWVINHRFQWNRINGMPTVDSSMSYTSTPVVKGWMYEMFSRWRITHMQLS